MPNTKTLTLMGAILIAVCGFLTTAAPAFATSKENVLHSFHGKDGGWPTANLIFDASGNLYGTTFMDGAHGCGTVFELTPQTSGRWQRKLLHTFNRNDGCLSNAGHLLFDASGNLYGTAENGGAHESGVVFELEPQANGTWTEKVLYSFCSASGCTDGSWPYANLVFDTAGNLYGLTVYGGTNSSNCDGFGCGTVFQLAPGAGGTWTETVLYSFCSMSGCADGAEPWTGLISDAAGNLYGMTTEGGRSGCELGCGTVFQLASGANGSWTETVLYSFCSVGRCTDGAVPYGSLIFDAAGNLYGTTASGGTHGNYGTVFQLVAGASGTWTEKVLHRFHLRENDHDGYDPFAGLVFDAAGSLYGTTRGGGAYGNYGTVFQLTPKTNGNWRETVLHSCKQHGKGGYAYSASLIFDAAGNLYGTAPVGGASGEGCGGGGCGTVFEIKP
jgi:uncharacterized repeat protein (TIGR03803 family)